MEHDDDVGPPAQGFGITRLLIAPIASVLRVDDAGEAQSARLLDRVVARRVIDEEEFVDDAGRHVRDGLLQGLRGIVSREDDDHCLAVDHGIRSRGRRK